MVKSKILRLVLMIIGFISLCIGVIGIILPILPTTPFLILTSFCFVRSSEYFNRWFLNTNIYKKHLKNFAKHKVMTLKGELILLSLVSIMLMTTMYFVNNKIVTIVLTCLIFMKYLYFVLQVKPVSKEEYQALQEEVPKC